MVYVLVAPSVAVSETFTDFAIESGGKVQCEVWIIKETSTLWNSFETPTNDSYEEAKDSWRRDKGRKITATKRNFDGNCQWLHYSNDFDPSWVPGIHWIMSKLY